MIHPINIPCSVHFDVQLYSCREPLNPLSSRTLVKELLATRNFFAINPTTICADPFLLVHKKRLYLFYEEMQKIYTNGKIKMICSNDLINWSEPVTVLESDYHLSYPFVFEAEDKIWMMPECWSSGGITLYCASDDSLTHWEKADTLITGEKLVDSSLFFKDGFWYMHVCSIENKKEYLRLYISEKIRGSWREHPCSPIKESRNGGSIHSENGVLYRFAQRQDIYYGDGLDLYEITVVSPQEYEEKKVCDHFVRKGHHCNILRFNGKYLQVVDHASLSFMPFEFLRRGLHFLKKVTEMIYVQ